MTTFYNQDRGFSGLFCWGSRVPVRVQQYTRFRYVQSAPICHSVEATRHQRYADPLRTRVSVGTVVPGPKRVPPATVRSTGYRGPVASGVPLRAECWCEQSAGRRPGSENWSRQWNRLRGSFQLPVGLEGRFPQRDTRRRNRYVRQGSPSVTGGEYRYALQIGRGRTPNEFPLGARGMRFVAVW